MNLEKIFKFIEDKTNYKTPITYKIINGLPLTNDELIVDGNLFLLYINITTLPDNLKVGGFLNLTGTKILSLPDNLKVGGSLTLSFTKITSLPDNLKVGGDLILSHTPLSKYHTGKQIKKMIEDKGGTIKGKIYI